MPALIQTTRRKAPEQLALEAAKLPVMENAGFENGLTGWTKVATPTFQVKTEGAARAKSM